MDAVRHFAAESNRPQMIKAPRFDGDMDRHGVRRGGVSRKGFRCRDVTTGNGDGDARPVIAETVEGRLKPANVAAGAIDQREQRFWGIFA